MKKLTYMYLILSYIILLNSFIIPVMALEETRSYKPVADSYINFYEPSLNYVNDPFLFLGYYWLSNESQALFEALIKFDVSFARLNFYKVVLRLDINYVSESTQLDIYETFSNWGENTITWNNAPPHEGFPLTSILVSNSGVLIIDVTEGLEDVFAEWSIHFALDDLNKVSISSRQCWEGEPFYDVPPRLVYHYRISDLPIIIGVSVGIGAVSIVILVLFLRWKKRLI